MKTWSEGWHRRLRPNILVTGAKGSVFAFALTGGKHKSAKTCVWVPKVLVSNVKGPKTV
jgi:hypothetical protein